MRARRYPGPYAGLQVIGIRGRFSQFTEATLSSYIYSTCRIAISNQSTGIIMYPYLYGPPMFGSASCWFEPGRRLAAGGVARFPYVGHRTRTRYTHSTEGLCCLCLWLRYFHRYFRLPWWPLLGLSILADDCSVLGGATAEDSTGCGLCLLTNILTIRNEAPADKPSIHIIRKVIVSTTYIS